MKHLGNVCEINGADIAPVDIITFGSPCQDMSVAGKRAGIHDGARSNLFFEAIRIIKEMREATHGEYPKYAVWENVPGAFSSNKGHDFHAVLEAFCAVCDDAVSIPQPHDAKRTKLVWSKSGEIVGDSFSIAWRTLDAQYWGVPQRRKRIYLVADFTGRRAGEILFKPDSLRGNMQKGNEEGKGVAADAVGSIDGSVGAISVDASHADDVARCEDTVPAMQARQYKGGNYVCMATQQGGAEIAENLCPTITAAAGMSGNNQPVIALQANGIDRADAAGCNGCGWRENESYTLNTIDRHAVRYDARNHNTRDISGTIQAKPNGGQSLNYINPVCYDARGNGDGETACTITGDHQNRITDYTAVAVQETYQAKTGPLMANSHPGSYTGQDAYSYMLVAGKAPKPPRKYIIRRLTPMECARLQGFPDNWGHLAPYNPADAEFWEDVRKTHAEINGKKYKPVKDIKKWYDKLHTDSSEYKMWGNGIALPNAEYVIHGIAEQGAKTLGSLFDGSGGFPLAGAMNGIAPLWASEVEPYPIAVTKSRLGAQPHEY